MTRMSNSALHYAQPLKFPNAAMRYGVEHKLLGLKFSGLGLHSVSRHAAAAFIASLSSSAFDRADNIHLRQAVVSCSLLPAAISVNFPTPTQNVCLTTNFSSSCWRFSSPANISRSWWQRSSSWLSVVPSPGMIWAYTWIPMSTRWPFRWWLGLDTSGRSMCPFCPDTTLHHACDLQAWGRCCNTP